LLVFLKKHYFLDSCCSEFLLMVDEVIVALDKSVFFSMPFLTYEWKIWVLLNCCCLQIRKT